MVAQPPVRPAEADIAAATLGPPASGGWTPASWRSKEARQMPKYDNPDLVTEVEAILTKQAPLVFAGEVCCCRGEDVGVRGGGVGSDL